MEKELQDKLFELLQSPEDWSVGSCTLIHESGLELWIENAPYADLHLYKPFVSKRVMGYWNRRKMRQLTDGVRKYQSKQRVAKLLESLKEDKTADAPPTNV